MTKAELYTKLNYVNATRISRDFYANLVLSQTELLKPLLEICFMIDDKISIRAAWILEFVCKTKLELIFPYLDYFVKHIPKLYRDSAIRPCAKILELLIIEYYQKKNDTIQQLLSKIHKEKITAICFDWLETDKKVAVKAYALTCLYYLGTEYQWIHPELKAIIVKDYNSESAGYKAKSRHILKFLER